MRCRSRFGPQPDRPSPQSQSLSRGYGSGLPTSLTYIVLSTRGCSPWRPAADMGTVRCGNHYSLPRIFKGRRESSGHRKSRGALQEQYPSLRASRFQGVSPLQRKENSSRVPRRRLRVRYALPLQAPVLLPRTHDADSVRLGFHRPRAVLRDTEVAANRENERRAKLKERGRSGTDLRIRVQEY